MNETNLKAVLAFDEPTSTFKPAGHNLAAEKAQEKTAKLQGQGHRAEVLDQPTRHKGRSYKTCASCKSAAENLFRQQGERPAEGEQAEAAPAVAEGAGEE